METDVFGRRGRGGGGRGGGMRGGGRGGRGGRGARGGRGGRGGSQAFSPALGMGHQSGYESLSDSYTSGGYDSGYSDDYAVAPVQELDIDSIADQVASNLQYGSLQPQGRVLTIEEEYGHVAPELPSGVKAMGRQLLMRAQRENVAKPSSALSAAAINFDAALTSAMRSSPDGFMMEPWLLDAIRLSSRVIYGDSAGAPSPSSFPSFGAIAAADAISASEKRRLTELEQRQAAILAGKLDPQTAQEISRISSARCAVLGLPRGCGQVSSAAFGHEPSSAPATWSDQSAAPPSQFSQSVKVGAGVALGVVGVFWLVGALMGGGRR